MALEDRLATYVIDCAQLYRVAVRLKGDMITLRKKLLSSETPKVSGNAVLKIDRAEDLVVVTFSDATEFAQINAHFAKVLRSLIGIYSISLDVLVDLISFTRAIERATKAAEATMRVHINVYGLSSQTDVVGQLLSKEKCFLQDPDHQRPVPTYRNPDMFVFQDNESSTEGNIIRSDDQVYPTSNGPKQDVREAVEDIFASLERRTHLNRIAGASSLKTDLLPHQQEALDFMTQREAGPIPQVYRLWKSTTENGQDW